jgi:ABC-type Na+ efflux pump permease subunit
MSLRPNARVEVRKKGYKLAVDADEARRKREDGMVEIRKSKRDENLLKKRREGTPAQHLPIAPQTVSIEKKVRNKPRSKKEEMVAALRDSFFLFSFFGTSGSDRPGSFCRFAWIMLIF